MDTQTFRDLKGFFKSKIEVAEHTINRKTQNLRRLEAQRNNLNARVRLLREELQLLQEPGSYVGEVVKLMGKTKVLVKTGQEGKYIVDFATDIKLEDLRPNLRVALRSDSYQIHRILPTKTDPLVSLMMVEKVPDSTYEMVGGLDKQIKEVKEVIELRKSRSNALYILFTSFTIASHQTSRALRVFGYSATERCLIIRAARHRQDPARTSSSASYRLSFHPRIRI